MTNYTQEQIWDAEIVAESTTTDMVGKVWEGNDGWYGEVADQNDYCQGCAWATSKDLAIEAVKQEIAVIDATSQYYTNDEYQQ